VPHDVDGENDNEHYEFCDVETYDIISDISELVDPDDNMSSKKTRASRRVRFESLPAKVPDCDVPHDVDGENDEEHYGCGDVETYNIASDIETYLSPRPISSLTTRMRTPSTRLSTVAGSFVGLATTLLGAVTLRLSGVSRCVFDCLHFLNSKEAAFLLSCATIWVISIFDLNVILFPLA